MRRADHAETTEAPPRRGFGRTDVTLARLEGLRAKRVDEDVVFVQEEGHRREVHAGDGCRPRFAAGRRPRQIADELVISPKTVSNHIQKILAKLGAHSSAEAVAIAYREGLGRDADVTAHSLTGVPA
jgi:hypothetical protein